MESTGKRSKNLVHQEVSDPPVPADGRGVKTGPHASSSCDRNNRNMFKEVTEERVVVPFEGPNPCPTCLRRGRNFIFLKPTELNKHIQEEHLSVKISWSCRLCGKTFGKLHPLSCHLPRCKGERVEHTHRCATCNMSFPTKSGLSQHERHRHPVVRNEKRTAAANNTPKPKGAPSTVWSEEEINKLVSLNETYAGRWNINVLIAQQLSNKTNKQVSDKRKQLAMNKSRPETHVSTLTGDAIEEEQFDPAEKFDASVPLVESAQTHESPSEAEFPPSLLPDTSLVTVTPATDEATETSVVPLEGVETWREKLRQFVLLDGTLPQAWTNWNDKANEMASMWPVDTNQIESLYQEIEKHLCGPQKEKKARKARGKKPNGGGVTNNRRNHGKKSKNAKQPSRSERRRFDYARCQELFNNEPKKLADIIASNDMSLLRRLSLPNKAQTVELYERLWGIEGPKEALPFDEGDRPPTNIEEVLTPICAGEIEEKIKHIKNKSAPGPDGITKGVLKREGVSEVLAKFFNILLMSKYYPNQWRKNRTTLIPKVGKDPGDIKNWRPITISSMLSRIFSALVDRRLRRTIEQSDRQKGFKHENGCFANVRILSSALKILKEKGGVLGIEDVAKAFDTVPHGAIIPALRRKGVHPEVAAYVASMYNNCETSIKTEEGGVPITLKRGVKQGDPLSPLIFNLCIEPIIERLQADTEGIKIEGRNLTAMAFADDLVLIGANKETAEKQMQMLVEYLGAMGMELSISKCTALEFVRANKSWHVRDPEMNINGVKVPTAQVGEAIRYLGTKITPWKGLIESFEYDAFVELMMRLKRVPIKPMQKLELLTMYLLPRYTYGLIMNPPSQNTLTKINRLVREEVKMMLHISEKTNTPFMYVPKRLGGLGLVNIEDMVKIAVLKNAKKAKDSKDPITGLAITYEKIEPRLKEYAKSLGVNWPTTLEDLDICKGRMKNGYIGQWAQLKVQGQGASEYLHRESNAWLTRNNIFKHSRIADAIKLRTNTYPTRVCMKQFVAKGQPQFDTTCRRCRGPQETLGHILGECCVTKPKRIHRHNEIRDLIANNLAADHMVCVEQSFQSETGTLKPDLVIKMNEEEAYVVDITVRFEKGDYLSKAADEKRAKYQELIPHVKRQLGVSKASVMPIVIGSRGAIPTATIGALKKLGLSSKEAVTMSMIAIRSSVEMANEFMDYGRTTGGGG